jgi:hypothetical protein
MNNIHQLQHSRARFNIVSVGLVLLTSGLLILVVGTLLPLQLTLLIQWLNLCGLVLIYIAVAIFVGLFKAKLDDYTGKGDSLF